MKKGWKFLFDSSLELREQLFRNIIILGSLAGIIAGAESVALGNFSEVAFAFIILYLVMGISVYMTLKWHKLMIAAILMGIVLSCILFPTMFFQSGGIEGGATVWFVFSIFYMFIMFTGYKLVLSLAIAIISSGTCYMVAYFCPDKIIPVSSRMGVYFDSFFGVVAVGFTASLMMRSQIKMYKREKEITELQTKELEKAGDYKNAFFANVSHEIRTPINSILGLNEMILRENISPEVEGYVKNSNVASQMLLSMVNDFLDISQIELKKMTILKSEYHTKRLFGNLIDVVQVLAEEKGLDFYVDIDENLPSVLLGDQKRVQQIMMNLVSNAIKYTQTGSVTVKVSGERRLFRNIPGIEASVDILAKASRNENVVLKISVTDTGIGIRKEELDHLYESFRRLDRVKNQATQGTGLGLFITKQLIDMMEGTISVDSIYTKGTTFTVEIEQGVTDDEKVGNFLHWNDSDGENVSYQRAFEAPEARVLVVDDNHINRMVTKDLLAQTRVMVDLAKNGEECLTMTKRKYYHVILMDYMLPDMDGAMIMKQLRRQENGLCHDSKVILVTANSLSEARRIFQENRFDGYLEKPVNGKLLEEEILKFIPSDLIEYRADGENVDTIKQISTQKHRGICITSDCVCEIPKEWMEKYEIQLMYLYIKTEHGRFADTKEINSNYLSDYLSSESSKAHSVSASVDEYEEFFAEVLTDSEEIIHISMASGAGVSYGTAVNAAKCFDHVHVVDSGQISGGQGLVVMHAAKLVMEGVPMDLIMESIEEMKQKVVNRFIMPSMRIFYQHGYGSKLLSKLIMAIDAHPILTMRQSRLVVTYAGLGSMENAKKSFVRLHLRNAKKIDPSVVFITHVGCTVKEVEDLKRQVVSIVPFKDVIIEFASVSNACNAGEKSVGIAYFRK